MTKQTFIYLHTMDPLQVSWIICQDNHVEQSILRGQLADLPPKAKENITVIVPAKDILLTETAIPKLNRQRLMQALPFALEEQLITDVTELHFAVATYQANGTLPVAIVARKKMDAWLALLKQFTISPSRLVSAVFALPVTEPNWSLYIAKENCTLRQNEYNGFASEHHNLTALIELTLTESPQKPTSLDVYNTLEKPVSIQVNSLLINEITLTEQAMLEKIPAWFDANPGINLLQGNYATKRGTSQTKKIWQLAGYTALAWIVLLFFGNFVSFLILHHHVSQQENKINMIYKKNFPQATSIVAPKERMEDKLKKLTDDSTKNTFLALLAKVGKNVSKATHVKLKNVDFRDNQLTLELIAAKFDDIDMLIKTLTQQGLNVKQQNAAVAGEKVKATLLVRGAT